MQTRIERGWREALAGEASEHVPYEALARSVDGELTEEERRRIEDHLDACSTCRDEHLDLLELSSRMKLRPRRRWRRRRTFWLASAAAAAVIAVIVIGVWKPATSVPRNAATPVATSKPIITPKALPPQQLVRDGDRVYPIVDGRIEGLTPKEQAIVDTLARGAQPAAALLGILRPSRGSLRGATSESGEVTLDEPVGLVVEEDRPVFRWQSRTRQSKFIVEVYDERFHGVAVSGELSSTEWRPAQPLERGRTYSWQVVRLDRGREVFPKPPVGLSRFRVISAAAADELRTTRTKGSHLQVALLYAREGMTDSATRELRYLAEANPDVGALRKLLEGSRSNPGAERESARVRKGSG